jgi:hypothetical protein
MSVGGEGEGEGEWLYSTIVSVGGEGEWLYSTIILDLGTSWR